MPDYQESESGLSGLANMELTEEQAIAEFLADPTTHQKEEVDEVVHKPSKSVAPSCRRRSADVDIANVILSPNSPTDLPQISGRRSHRIRRKSLEIYRTSARQKELEQEEVECEVEESDEKCTDIKSSEEGALQSDMTRMEKAVTDNIDSQECLPCHGTGNTEDIGCIVEEGIQPSTSTDTAQATGNKRSRKKVTLSTSLPEPSTTPSDKRKGSKRKREPSVEDIYLNKLWRTQMPKEKAWETIFEQPRVSKFGQEEHQSCKKLKRAVNFDSFYTTARLKKRREKAVRQGWKPMSKKKEAKMSKLVADKIENLDKELVFGKCEKDNVQSKVKNKTVQFAMSVELEGMEGVEMGDDSVFESVSESQDGTSVDQTTSGPIPEPSAPSDVTPSDDQTTAGPVPGPSAPRYMTPIKGASCDQDLDDIFYTPAKSMADLLKYTSAPEDTQTEAAAGKSNTKNQSDSVVVPPGDSFNTPPRTDSQAICYKEFSPDF